MLTEKTEAIKNPSANVSRYTLKIRTDANKELVKQALYKIYNIKTVKVNVVNVKGKNRRFRQEHFRLPSWKKAIVTLAPGQTIDFGKTA